MRGVLDARERSVTTKETRSKHGTRSRYVGGCRCEDCRTANAADRRARVVRRPLVSVAPVVTHLRALQSAGMSRARIAHRAGVAESTLDRIAREPGTQMRGDIARAVMGVQVPSEVEP
jgi:lambda repressor-like predicted transcriptional regulator